MLLSSIISISISIGGGISAKKESKARDVQSLALAASVQYGAKRILEGCNGQEAHFSAVY